MIRGEYWELQEDRALAQLDAAAVRLLSRTGVRVEHEGLRRSLEGAGCAVEETSRRCRFPETLIREAVEHLREPQPSGVSLPVGWSPALRTWQGGNFPHLLDWPSGRRRLATPADVAEIARLGHALEEVSTVGKTLTCAAIDQRVEPLWNALVLARITDKPTGAGEIFYPEVIAPLVRMGEVLTGQPGETVLVSSCDFFISPLTLDGLQAACFLEKRRHGIMNVPGTMAVAGISAPVTVAGTAAVALAEMLAGWVMGYVVAPELPASGIVSTGTLDLRTMAACFNSPEALLQDVTVVQASRRLYGIRVRAAVGYVDCKRPGIEAAYQKMLPLVATPFGTDLLPAGGGLLSAGQDYSPLQDLLDAEMRQAVRRFWSSYTVDEDTLALDLIEQIALSGKTDFLGTEHTATHYREEQWYPRWLDRSLWQGGEIETRREGEMLERINQYCREAIASYEPPQRDPEQLAELERIFRAYEREVLGAEVTEVPG